MADILNLPKPRQRSKPFPSKEAFPHNLPVQPTPFIGREKELSEIDKLLNEPTCRLLTLVGPGGIGKTRLALEAVSQRIGDYPHGVWFVPFVGVSSPEHIVPTLADSLKFSFYGAADPKVQILNYLKEKKMLLIMDNFEHLLGGAGLVSEILTTAPGVKCVVTSRELLKLKEEWAFQVKGLDYPKGEKPEEAVEDFGAVQLFLQGAKRSDTSFRLSQEDEPFVVQVCQGVEGMPLGIELASSWVRALSLREIAGKVGKSLGFLATVQKDIPERHRSLKAVFEQSYSFLTPEEQRAFRRMSVFRGGFKKEAAEKVACATLPVIASLIDKSFIRKAPSGRYEVHELMRQFGEEKLKGRSQEKKKAKALHAEYYAEFLHEREEDLNGAKQKQALEEIGEEIDNVRAGWLWAVDQGDVKTLEKAINGLGQFYHTRSWFREGQSSFEEAIGKLHQKYQKSRVFGSLLRRQGWCSYNLGHLVKAKELFERSLLIFHGLDYLPGVADLHYALGEVHMLMSDFPKAKPYLQKSLQFFKKMGNQLGKKNSLEILGDVAFGMGNTRDGIKYLQESLGIGKKLGRPMSVAYPLLNLSIIFHSLGKFEEATRMRQESLTIFREIGDRRGQTMVLQEQGYQAFLLGEYSEAKRLIHESLAISKEIGDQFVIAWNFAALGRVALSLGEYGEAERLFQESLEGRKEAGDQGGIGYCHWCMGRVSEVRGDYAEAKRLYQECLITFLGLGMALYTIDALRGLGDVACALGEYKEAEEWLKKALRKAVECELALHILDVLTSFAELQAKQGDKEKAFELCALVLLQPVCKKETQVRAEKLFSELKAELTAKVVALAKKQGESKSVEDVAEEILGERVEPSGEAKLRVSLLGPPKVLFGDREISDKAWGLKRAKKLFCYLALLGEKGLPRDEVIEAFWPKAGPKKGLDSLYSSLTAIRKVLKAEAGVEGQVVSLEEGRCGLDPKVEVYLDVEEFESLLKKGKQRKEEDQRKTTQKALSLVRGRFCEGWYDSWVVEAERSVSGKHLEALRTFGMACLQDGKLEESITCLEKALALDNLHEETCRNLMTAYAKAGKKKALLETYANLKTRLKKELGAEPEPKTVELYEKLIK